MTPLILALDTTGERGSVALLAGETVSAQALMDSPDGFAHVLYGHVEDLLGSVGARIGNVDCFAGASGPGLWLSHTTNGSGSSIAPASAASTLNI